MGHERGKQGASRLLQQGRFSLKPRPLQKREWVVLGVGIISLLLTLDVWYWMRTSQQEKAAAEFEFASKRRIQSIAQALETRFSALKVFAAFYAASQTVERHEFAAFANTELEASIDAFQWAPRVAPDEVSQHEAAGREAVGPDYRIWSAETESPGPHLGIGEVHYPVFFAGSRRPRFKEMIGFDLASDPNLRLALIEARDAGDGRL